MRDPDLSRDLGSRVATGTRSRSQFHLSTSVPLISVLVSRPECPDIQDWSLGLPGFCARRFLGHELSGGSSPIAQYLYRLGCHPRSKTGTTTEQAASLLTQALQEEQPTERWRNKRIGSAGLLCIERLGFEPSVWRKTRVPAAITLRNLHHVLHIVVNPKHKKSNWFSVSRGRYQERACNPSSKHWVEVRKRWRATARGSRSLPSTGRQASRRSPGMGGQRGVRTGLTTAGVTPICSSMPALFICWPNARRHAIP